MRHTLWLLCCMLGKLIASSSAPCITVVVADWGMEKKLHDQLLPHLDGSYTLTLHVLGDRSVATGQHTLLVQVPTLQELQQAERYREGCVDQVRQRIKGVWVENNDGESPYPSSSIPPYLVFSQPPLHPNPPVPGENTLVGNFWVSTKLPLPERQKIYDMATAYAKQAGGCMLSVTFATQEAWDHFRQWVPSLKGVVRFVNLAEYAKLMQAKAKKK